jgi:uncharacterized protein YndB with AHSA1/START domain
MNAPEHERYRRTWIDHTVDVEASSEAVFRLMSDIDGWPSWVPGMTELRRVDREPPRVGTRFTMMIKPARFHPPLPIPCVLKKLEPGGLEWGADLLGSRARHRFEFEALSPARTRVHQVEYATDALALLARIAEPGIYKHNLRWQNALRDRLAQA